MTQEEKQLVLKDLCARLQHGVKVNHFGVTRELLGIIPSTENVMVGYDINEYEVSVIEDIKPYLRPMSSMTKEEENEYKMFIDYSYNDFTSESFPCVYVDKINDYLDWLNAHQFDYRGLIPMGLALPATEGIYNIK